jgi:hypothetical protein
VEPLGDSALLGHNRNGETGWRDGCIDAYSLERLQPHWPFLDGSELPTHNPWSALTIFAISCSSQAEWISTSDSHDLCRCAPDYPRDSASRLLMHELWPRAPGHVWGSSLCGATAVVKHRQLHDHLVSIRLQCLCQMHHNTRQTACQCGVEPTTQVQWREASSKWGMSHHIAGSIWTWHPSLRAWWSA